MTELGRLLRELRQAKGLSVRRAAMWLDISHSRLADFERGATHSLRYKAVPGREILMKMAEFYGYPLETLLAMAVLPEVEPAVPAKPSEIELGAQEVAQIFRDLPTRDRTMFLKLARTYRDEAVSRANLDSAKQR